MGLGSFPLKSIFERIRILKRRSGGSSPLKKKTAVGLTVYQTSLAVTATCLVTLDSDLSIRNSDLKFQPPMTITLPVDVTLTAILHNPGETDADNIKIHLYEGKISEDTTVEEKTVNIP